MREALARVGTRSPRRCRPISDAATIDQPVDDEKPGEEEMPAPPDREPCSWAASPNRENARVAATREAEHAGRVEAMTGDGGDTALIALPVLDLADGENGMIEIRLWPQ